MLNLALKYQKPILKQFRKYNLKGIKSLQRVKIFAMPTRIKDSDILAMFKGLIGLITEKAKQEQTEKYLQLKLQYRRLKLLYNSLKLRIK